MDVCACVCVPHVCGKACSALYLGGAASKLAWVPRGRERTVGRESKFQPAAEGGSLWSENSSLPPSVV